MSGPGKVGGAQSGRPLLKLDDLLIEELQKPREYCEGDKPGIVTKCDVRPDGRPMRFAGTAKQVLERPKAVKINGLSAFLMPVGYYDSATSPELVVVKLDDKYANIYGPFVVVKKEDYNKGRAKYDKIGAGIETVSVKAETLPLQERVKAGVDDVVRKFYHKGSVEGFNLAWEGNKLIIKITLTKEALQSNALNEISSDLKRDIKAQLVPILHQENSDTIITFII